MSQNTLSEPLVSCIMVTRGRPEFARRAVECFEGQAYQHRELVVVDDTDAPSFPAGVTGEGIHYHRLTRRLTIGAKRNIACSRALGEIMANLDDDDISAPDRIADQVARLLETGAQVTGYNQMEFVEPDGTRWMYTHPQDWPDYALGTSLMYRRDYWKAHPFEDVATQEDNHFVWAARKAGAIVSVPARGLMAATIHPGNTSFRDRGPTQKNFVRVG